MQAIEPALDVAGTAEMLLVQSAQNGDLVAFEELVRRYDRQTFRLALHLTRNHEDAEDAVQEAFLNAFRGLARFQGRSRFSTWLFRIAVNQCLMKMRKRRGLATVSLDEQARGDNCPTAENIVDWRFNAQQLYEQSELRKILLDAIQKLPAIYRTVFLLRDVEGFSIEQTAEMLSVRASAIKSRLLRARLMLREHLNSVFPFRVRSGSTTWSMDENAKRPVLPRDDLRRSASENPACYRT